MYVKAAVCRYTKARRGSRLLGENLAHRVGGAPRRRVVVVGVPLKSERSGSVSREGLEVTDRLAVLGEQAKTRVP
jgi:hypothetical protein